MTFLAPSVLAGLGVIAAPIAIHLLNKMRVQIINWGAMRFLLESIRKNQRRLQVEDLILLLLRCLLIALLALAFARPVLHPEGTGAAASGGPTVAILIFDQSASMGQSNGVTTRFETAKANVDKVLNELPAGSQAGLYLVSDRVSQVINRPTSNLALIRRTLEATEPTDRISDLLPAIRLALDTLRPFGGSQKEIVIFTDNQQVAWKQLDQIKPLLAEAPDVNVKLVPLGDGGKNVEGEDNLAITALKAEENVVPAAGQLYGCMVEVTNFGAAPVSGVRVTLALDDEAAGDEAVIDSIPSGQARAVRLNVKFPQAGFHTLKASIPADRMPADNQRAMAVQVIDQMRAVIVEGTQPRVKSDRDAMFLANALAPVAPSQRADYFLKVEAVPMGWLDDADYSRQEMLFLANPGAISPPVATKLAKYVNDGGALIIFPGPNTNPDDLNTALKDILPATLGPVREPGKLNPLTPFASWQSTNLPHPITTLWNDAKNGTLSSIRASKYYPLTLVTAKVPADSALPVVKYNDGSVAVAAIKRGKGNVILFSTPANRIGDWTNLPLHPAFVPIIHRLAGFVVRHAEGALSISPGGAYTQTVNSDLVGREYSVIRPDSKGQPRIAGKVELFNREARVRYSDTEKSGAYRILINGSDRPVGAFAVQMDPAESNLHTVSTDQLEGIGKEQKNTVSTTATTASAGGERREFWALCIWLAAIIAVTEMVLAHKFSLAK